MGKRNVPHQNCGCLTSMEERDGFLEIITWDNDSIQHSINDMYYV